MKSSNQDDVRTYSVPAVVLEAFVTAVLNRMAAEPELEGDQAFRPDVALVAFLFCREPHLPSRLGVSEDVAIKVFPRLPALAPTQLQNRCGAKTRSGTPCRRYGMKNGRCQRHGGKATGPKTAEGKARIGAAVRARWARLKAAAPDSGEVQAEATPSVESIERDVGHPAGASSTQQPERA